MSDQPEEIEDEANDGAEGDEGDESALKKLLDKKKLLLFGAPVFVLLAVGGYFAVTASGLMDAKPAATAAGAPAVYYDLPEMVVNLSASGDRGQYLKLKVSLEAADPGAISALEQVMPRVLDLFQLYLRELRSDDLDGSAGIFRLKEELMRRINLELHPNKITRVLFKEIIIQ